MKNILRIRQHTRKSLLLTIASIYIFFIVLWGGMQEELLVKLEFVEVIVIVITLFALSGVLDLMARRYELPLKNTHIRRLTTPSSLLTIASSFIFMIAIWRDYKQNVYGELGSGELGTAILFAVALILMTLGMVSDFRSQAGKRPSKRK